MMIFKYEYKCNNGSLEMISKDHQYVYCENCGNPCDNDHWINDTEKNLYCNQPNNNKQTSCNKTYVTQDEDGIYEVSQDL